MEACVRRRWKADSEADRIRKWLRMSFGGSPPGRLHSLDVHILPCLPYLGSPHGQTSHNPHYPLWSWAGKCKKTTGTWVSRSLLVWVHPAGNHRQRGERKLPNVIILHWVAVWLCRERAVCRWFGGFLLARGYNKNILCFSLLRILIFI